MASQIGDGSDTRKAIAHVTAVADFLESVSFDLELILEFALPAGPWWRRSPRHEHDGTAMLAMAASAIARYDFR